MGYIYLGVLFILIGMWIIYRMGFNDCRRMLKGAFKQLCTDTNPPEENGWYFTSNGSLYWFNEEKMWSCRDDRVSDEYPQYWYKQIN